MEAIDFMFGCMGLLCLAAASLVSVSAAKDVYDWWTYGR